MSFFTVRLSERGVELLDQRLLPEREHYRVLCSGEEVARAIEEMAVRGAPAIGITAAMGVALELRGAPDDELEARLAKICERLRGTRPTAVNLAWALDRMRDALGPLFARRAPAAEIRAEAERGARRLHDLDLSTCRAIGEAGATLVPDAARVLTHCNAGGLATAGYGTALGVIRSAAARGRVARVLASETRPYLQGARLTTWELARDGIPVALITDSMSGLLMQRREIDLVVVGADRIARNGDVANKIGTYAHAVLARAHGIPFYVAAPMATIDLDTPTGREIPIEERSSEEVVTLAGRRIAPEGVPALHPAFDVTPAELVTAIVTERGIARPPYERTLAALAAESIAGNA
jgi:methylthioribose-1-phosphate isomerase